MKVRDVMTRDPRTIRSDATIEDAARAMRSIVQAGDFVLVKGSHGTRMDIVADRLTGATAAGAR